ncbi:hypothetical protein OE749_11325 [Aestuariibacter sp. AA17]|uniref:DUF3806 domain-containing protein n=1 Tax=Fluctibacter corallii TaxID=2984329 RepID=A0ABT3A9H3_9ALTE|nr:hypothetical protein [Aestuariibacter sp. AA17]MCV2885283.1 hypothetical protein [Aestuariibacter sp. AA17]
MDITREELEQLMADSAANAIETTRDEFGIELDGSVDSIKLVDDVLLQWLSKYQDQVLEDNAVFTLCNIYGAYIGEVFIKIVGGHWKYDTSDPEAPFVALEFGGHEYAFAGICYQRLVNDSQISVNNYFHQAVKNNQSE